jgi:hypothetical protein
MKRARRLIRRLLAVVLALAVVCLAALAVLNYYVLPRYGGGWVRDSLEGFLGRSVTFEHIDWNVLRGATITGLAVQHRSDVQSAAPFLEAQRIDARFRIASLVPFRIELMPELDGVSVRLIKSAGGEWNVADIADRFMRPRAKTPTARVSRLGFSRATVTIEDRYSDLPQQRVEHVTCTLTAPTDAPNRLNLAGRWHASGGRITLDATFGAGVQPLAKLGLRGPVIGDLQQLLAPEGPMFVHGVEGLASVVLMETKTGELAGRAQIDFDNAELEIEGFHIAGPISGSIDEITIRRGSAPTLALTGTMTLNGGRVLYMPPSPNGSLSSARAPAEAVPQMTYEGDGTIGFLVAGEIGERLSVTVSCALGHAQITTPVLQAPFRAIRGQVTYDGTGLKYTDVVGEIEGAVVTVNGSLDAFGQPNIVLDVRGDRIGGNARVKIRRVNGQRLPAFQIDGAGWIDAPLARLVLPPAVTETLDRLRVTGMATFEGRIARVAPGLENVRVRGQLGGVGLGVRGFGFDGITGNVHLERGVLKLYGLDGILYDGRFTGAWEADFATEGKPFKIDAALHDIEIGKLPLLTHVEDRKLHGSLGVNVNVNGRLDDLQKSFGKGKFRLRRGYVWEFKVFSELFKVLALRMPGMVKVVFERARGDFEIEGLALTTHNLYFESDLFQLLMDGTVDLHGNLDFVVDPLFLRERGGPIRNLARQILNIPANIIPRAIVRGTVKAPVVKPYLRPRLPFLKEIIR